MKFLKALSVFTGTIIGVGIFGLPYVALKFGFFPVILYFLLMSGIAITAHLFYSEISLGTKELHRLPGYAGIYFGSWWKKISLAVTGLGLIGALLAYLIVGGEFLRLFFAPYFGEGPLIYTFFFWGCGTFLIFRGIKNISKIELTFLAVFFGILILFYVKASPLINMDYLKNIDFKFLTLPYGIILFSLWGLAVVPEVKEMLGGDRKPLRKTMIWGILIAALTYLFFIFIVLGASGPNTSKEAMSGLPRVLGDNIIRLGFIFGIITCFTSFIALGLTLKKVFWYDFGLSKNLSWFIACCLPIFLFLVGLREFIDVIGLTGAIAIGAEGIIVVFLYREFLKKRFSRRMNPLAYILPAFFILGIAFEVFYFFFAK